MSYRPVSAIEIRCWGSKVGIVAPDPACGCYAFEFFPDFARKGVELSPLMLPTRTSGPVVFPELPEATYYRLPAFVADSLPDKFGNALIDAWMARQGMSVGEFSVLDRLAYVGSRAMGALEFVPAIRGIDAGRPSALEAKDIVEAARKALVLSADDLAKDSSAALSQLMRVGTSAGGAKAKAILGLNPATGEMISGQFNLPDGFEPWLLKIDTSESRPYGVLEFAYSLAARACGIHMEECSLMEIDGKRHFMTRRFDRLPGGERVHMQTLCAMAGLDYNMLAVHDYAQLFDTAKRLGLDEETHDQIFLRMVFNVCMCNNDDHAKNHSFTLRQGESWELAPAYDLTHANNPGNKWLAQHAMGVQGKHEDITREDLLKTGEEALVRNPAELIDQVLDVANSWGELAKQAELSAHETDRVAADIKECAERLR